MKKQKERCEVISHATGGYSDNHFHDTTQAASNRALTLLSENRIAKGSWRGKTPDGREMLCAYLALRNGNGEDSTDNCPAWLCPQWVADLIPSIDDKTSDANWKSILERLFTQVARWNELTLEAWSRINIGFRIGVIEEAVSHVTVDKWGVKDACRLVIEALKGNGDLEEARKIASAAYAAYAAAAYAAYAAANAADYAARAADYAANAAANAAANSWDRMSIMLLDLIDGELST